jgi:hypothetical protein
VRERELITEIGEEILYFTIAAGKQRSEKGKFFTLRDFLTQIKYFDTRKEANKRSRKRENPTHLTALLEFFFLS